ncbi:hypothetical protein FPOAC2_03488 [Fusarium poae]
MDEASLFILIANTCPTHYIKCDGPHLDRIRRPARLSVRSFTFPTAKSSDALRKSQEEKPSDDELLASS